MLGKARWVKLKATTVADSVVNRIISEYNRLAGYTEVYRCIGALESRPRCTNKSPVTPKHVRRNIAKLARLYDFVTVGKSTAVTANQLYVAVMDWSGQQSFQSLRQIFPSRAIISAIS